MIKKILFSVLVLVAIVATSCITKKRCENRFPCDISMETTTIIRDTTIIAPLSAFDTIFKFSGRDTIRIWDSKTRIETKIVRIKGDSIFIRTICPADTIFVPQIVRTTTVQNHGRGFIFDWSIMIPIILILIIVSFIYYTSKK